ncbi:MAG: hypothetical protein H7A43_06975 [Verrucomicrobia bacterium]|nr:hypothetical protein [Kiritimatiellia bacterium]MCP5488376.1 hypothetical protein [Verrucomicrobiota bacterium]
MRRTLGWLVLVWMMSARPGLAQSILYNSTETRLTEDFAWIPYAFSSASFGLGFGVGASYSGWPAEESSLIGAATLGTKFSYNFALGASDLRVPGAKRLYVEPLLILGKYQDQFIYAGRNNPGFEGQRAGANDSDADHYVEATQWDNRAEVLFRYLLPVGHGRDENTIISRYVLKEGLLASGATGGASWNPMTSGRTYLKLTPQVREQTYANDDLNAPLRTLNLETAVERENWDFPFNPTRGSYQRVAYTRDFDSDEALGEWDLWEVDLAKVFNLGQTGIFRQQVLALNGWTAYTPSWETDSVDGQAVVTRRPPPYAGATLGGLTRMRGFEDNRFQDKAAIYYAAEYRVIPEWQPLRHITALEWADISYWQFVAFVEAGQVSPDWRIDDLHSDLHIDGGVGLRGMLHKAVCRLDVAVSEEGLRITAMYGHPF